jgi:hypothetical protein
VGRTTTDGFIVVVRSSRNVGNGARGERFKATHLQAHGLLHEAFHETADTFALPRSQQNCVRRGILTSEGREHHRR